MMENGAGSEEKKFERTAACSEGGGKVLVGVQGGKGESGETIGGPDPEGGGEKEVGGFGGGAELVGEPKESGERGNGGENFAEGIVIVAAGEGEESEDGGLERAERAFFD